MTVSSLTHHHEHARETCAALRLKIRHAVLTGHFSSFEEPTQ